jgi:pyrimidine-specific ribonucleoside hydrolase
VHGDDGLGGANLPPPSRKPVSEDAVAFLRDELRRAEEPVTIIALAPLTNIALLLQSAPDVKRKIKRVALMGGAYEIGNATPVAEFNLFHDPEAADIVFRSGLPLLMYGLEVFRKVRFTREEATRWFAPDGNSSPPRNAAELAAHLLHFAMDNFSRPDATIGDGGCVACVIDPTGLQTARLPVYVETGGNFSRGQTVVDRRPPALLDRRPAEAEQALIEVALDIDGDYYRHLFREAVTA